MKIRLARGGSKKRPFYRIVAADSRMPRDGRFIEKLGTYNPLLPKDSEERVTMNMDRINYWLGEGAQPTDRISRMLEAAGAIEKKDRNNPKKAEPGQKAKDRAQEKADKLAAAEEAPAVEAAAEEAPAVEAAAEEAPAAEAAAEEAPAAEAAAEAAAEEAPAVEAAAEEAPAVEEAPAAEAAAEEAPAAEAAAEEAPAAEAAAEEAPAAEAEAEKK